MTLVIPWVNQCFVQPLCYLWRAGNQTITCVDETDSSFIWLITNFKISFRTWVNCYSYVSLSCFNLFRDTSCDTEQSSYTIYYSCFQTLLHKALVGYWGLAGFQGNPEQKGGRLNWRNSSPILLCAHRTFYLNKMFQNLVDLGFSSVLEFCSWANNCSPPEPLSSRKEDWQ